MNLKKIKKQNTKCFHKSQGKEIVISVAILFSVHQTNPIFKLTTEFEESIKSIQGIWKKLSDKSQNMKFEEIYRDIWTEIAESNPYIEKFGRN